MINPEHGYSRELFCGSKEEGEKSEPQENQALSSSSHTRKNLLRNLGGIAKFVGISAIAAKGVDLGLDVFLDSFAEAEDVYDFENSCYEVWDSVEVNGKKVRPVGVSHLPNTLFANEADIVKKVKLAPFVFLEYFWEKDRKRALPSTSDEELLAERTYDDLTGAFFAGIGRICAAEGKDVIVVNPQSKISYYTELYLLFGLPVSLIATGNKKRERLSRRSFLRKAGAGVAGLVWLPWVFPNASPVHLRWNLIDYRDVRSAKGIDKAIKRYGDKIGPTQEVPLFQGRSHNSGMVKYLQDPRLREAKAFSYLHYRLAEENTIRRYTYNAEVNSWLVKEKVEY